MPDPLPLPEHYTPDQAAQVGYVPDIQDLADGAQAWREGHGLKPAATDDRRVELLVIDAQVDFSFPEGALYVAGRSGTGAVDANRKLAEFIYRNLGAISMVTCTLDTHVPYQIFFPAAHQLPDGRAPAPHTIVTAEDIQAGRIRPSQPMADQLGVDVDFLIYQFTHYCQQLEQEGKHQLYLWPYHCLQGTAGHRLAGVIDAARLFHGFARGAGNRPVEKGEHPLSERYSVFSEEVPTAFNGQTLPGIAREHLLIDRLLTADALIVAGLASSHCVMESVNDLLTDIRKRDETLAGRVFLLRDCTAPVVVPGVSDFTDDAEQAFERFAAAGMHVLTSDVPMADWPQEGRA